MPRNLPRRSVHKGLYSRHTVKHTNVAYTHLHATFSAQSLSPLHHRFYPPPPALTSYPCLLPDHPYTSTLLRLRSQGSPIAISSPTTNTSPTTNAPAPGGFVVHEEAHKMYVLKFKMVSDV